MILNKAHRQSLLVKLATARKEKQEKLSIMERLQQKKDFDQSLFDTIEMDLFVLYKQIDLIEQSIIDNEIDF